VRRLVQSAGAGERLTIARRWLDEQAPGAPVLVLAPSAIAAAELARAASAEAIFGRRRDTPLRFATELALAGLAERGLVPAGGLVLEALAARVVHLLAERGELGRFAAVADQPGLPRALARTLGELRALAALPPVAPELARVVAAFEAELTRAGLADRAVVLELATARCRDPRAHEAGLLGAPLLLLDVPIAGERDALFLGALAARSSDVLASAAAGDALGSARLAELLGVAAESLDTAPPRDGLARLQRGLFASPVGSGRLGAEVVVMSAPGESRECVEVARRIRREAERGVPFERMAVLLRTPERYRAHIAEALRRAGIPAHYARGSLRPDPAGRAFAALLACAGEGLSARRFAEYLSLGEVPDDIGGAPPPAAPASERWAAASDEELVPAALTAPEGDEEIAPPVLYADPEAETVRAGSLRAPRRWEALMADAAVIGGRARWERRLAGLAAELEQEVRTLEEEKADHARRRLGDLRALSGYALPLLAALEALPASATWGAWIEALGALATRALRRPARVLAVLAELWPMADLGPVALAEVRLVLSRRLSQLVAAPAEGRAGKVLVAPCESARGMAFDVVFVPGLAERLFPQKVIEDPVLRDAERAALSPWLAQGSERVAAERLALRLAVGAASDRVVLSYPRLDVDQARPRVPSFYGLEVLHAATGHMPSFAELSQAADVSGAARIGWPAPARARDAIDEAEHDLALLADVLHLPADQTVGTARYLLECNPHLARALRFRARRWLRRWTHADGLVHAPPGALAAEAFSARSYSATALQNYARCPYKFYLQALVRLSPRQAPEAIEEMDPLQRGALVHDVQFELLESLRAEGLLPLDDGRLEAAQARLEDVLGAVAARHADTLAPAIDRVWHDSIATIRADLREWLRRVALEPAWEPWRFELAFGLPPERGRDEHSRREPVLLDSGIQLRGSIDLVEKNRAGLLRATDHKTGKVRAELGAVIGGGETLQPVLYALALEKLFPDAPVASGRLFYCTQTGGFEERVFELDAEAREAAAAVAATIGSALERGFLPAAPARRACEWCEYLPVCGPYEEVRSARKPRRELEPLVALRRRP
jgi:ATP-dependent helicase/nuclease subunit B